eukprot:7218010-Lingulodinium_polyedra.AAC.1
MIATDAVNSTSAANACREDDECCEYHEYNECMRGACERVLYGRADAPPHPLCWAGAQGAS